MTPFWMSTWNVVNVTWKSINTDMVCCHYTQNEWCVSHSDKSIPANTANAIPFWLTLKTFPYQVIPFKFVPSVKGKTDKQNWVAVKKNKRVRMETFVAHGTPLKHVLQLLAMVWRENLCSKRKSEKRTKNFCKSFIYKQLVSLKFAADQTQLLHCFANWSTPDFA